MEKIYKVTIVEIRKTFKYAGDFKYAGNLLVAVARNLFPVLAITVYAGLWCPVSAQSLGGSAAAGQQQYVSAPTGYQSQQDTSLVPAAPQGQTWDAGQNQNGNESLRKVLPFATTTQFDRSSAGWFNDALPPTMLDSFVWNSGYNDTIYGDEGDYGPPPYMDFNTIGSGLNHPFLTTGHASPLPSAWGYTTLDAPWGP